MNSGFDQLSTPSLGTSAVRGAAELLRSAVRRSTCTAIIGPRQSGKSTLALALTRPAEDGPAGDGTAEDGSAGDGDAAWTDVTFDDPLVLGFAQRDPAGFLSHFPAPLIIDEVQRFPELILPLKQKIDQDRTPGRYVLTGSANIFDHPKTADSLAGRVEQITLLPLSQAEIEGNAGENFLDCLAAGHCSAKGKSDSPDCLLLERIVRGGFPEPVMRSSAADRAAWHDSFIRAAVDRDVRDQLRMAKTSELPRLLRLTASRSGELLNTAGLSRDSGMKETTLHRCWDVLKRLFLIQEVPAFRLDMTMRLIKAPKAFLADTGLACRLLGRQSFDRMQDEFLIQALIEAFVANEIARLAAYSESQPQLFHFRTVRQHEVDFVLEYPDGGIVAINAAAGASPAAKSTSGLEFLREYAGSHFKAGIVLYEGTRCQPIDTDIWAVPYDALWRPSLHIQS